jgi:hypothetical protein
VIDPGGLLRMNSQSNWPNTTTAVVSGQSLLSLVLDFQSLTFGMPFAITGSVSRF